MMLFGYLDETGEKMSGLRLSRFISNSMVLQRDKKGHIWGCDAPGARIKVSFLGKTYEAVADSEGSFGIWIDEQPFGGPYELSVSDDAGNSITVTDVMVGEVWLCSGQSNMELPMARVKDKYPDEMVDCDHPGVREFKIAEEVVYAAPLEEPKTGQWRRPAKEYISEFSATAYFFAKEFNKLTGIPVGFINLSLGGSPVHSWMSREMLEGFDDKLAIADKYADDDFRASVLKANEEEPAKWHKALDEKDEGLKGHWEADDTDDDNWETIMLPGFLRDTEIGNYIGVIYFRKSFTVPADMAGKEAGLWLGTLVDSDITYVNGQRVGNTEYQYPPRKYVIPEGLLREGTNNVTVRLKSEYYLEFMDGDISGARFTPGKEYKVFNDEHSIDISGEWKYRLGAQADSPAPRQDFVSWKPTCLFNGMTAPCRKYVVGGLNWYQGESDCEDCERYKDMFERMVEGYRRDWNYPDMPVNIVQLPNFTIDNNPDSDAWNRMRETLRRLGESIDNCASAVTIDLGEDNDLHPQGKREIGRRLALLAAHEKGCSDAEYSGPVIRKFMCVKEGDTVCITLDMEHTGNGLKIREANGKGSDLKVVDFIVVDVMNNMIRADADIEGNRIILKVPGLKHSVKEIRYCYSQTNNGALIYNSEGLPMSPGIYVM